MGHQNTTIDASMNNRDGRPVRVLIFGISGMLGNAVFRVLSGRDTLSVYGTVRSDNARRYFPDKLTENIVSGVDIEDEGTLGRLFQEHRPDVVINCVGVIKQLSEANDVLKTVPINTLFPHRLARLCGTHRARLILIGTDCVFSGRKGNYTEDDFPDCYDLYGRSKLLGEIHDKEHVITLRTSIIGHELGSHHSLVDWFLHQEGSVNGYTRAIFSGLPTPELAKLIRDVVIPNQRLFGLYHVAADPINKCDLLTLVARVYGKTISIIPSDRLVIDRSLNARRFLDATGYKAKPWPALIQDMFEFRESMRAASAYQPSPTGASQA